MNISNGYEYLWIAMRRCCELQNIHRARKNVALTKAIYFRNGSLTQKVYIVRSARNSPRRAIF